MNLPIVQMRQSAATDSEYTHADMLDLHLSQKLS